MERASMKRNERRWLITFCIVLVFLLLGFVAREVFMKFEPIPKETGMEIYFFDVGQADCALIRLDGHTMLIDAGNKSDANSNLKVTDNINLVYELKQLGVEKIDFFINTHPHEDHMGGSATIVENFEIGKIIAPNNEYDNITTKFYTEFEEIVNAKNIQWIYPTTMTDEEVADYEAKRRKYCEEHASEGYTYAAQEYIQIGDSFNFGEAVVTILSPNADSYKEKNNYSIALKIEYEGNSILFTGDIEEDAEAEIVKMAIEKGINLNVDILKSAHHGSETSSSQEFFDSVDPEFIVISCGWDNTYGHPDDITIERYRENRSRIFRTDMLGDIIVYMNDGEIIFDTWSYLHTKKD